MLQVTTILYDRPMRSTLLLIRHAETALAGTFCGATDPPLNDRGRAQLPGLIARLSARTDAFPLNAVYTSDLLRARETAEAIAADTPIHVRPALRQIDFGRWETLTWQQIEDADPIYAARWISEFPNLPPGGGEPIPLFRHRVLQEFAFIRQQLTGQTIAVVTHSTVLRVLLEGLGHFSAHHAWESTRDYTCLLCCTQTSATSPLSFL